MQITIQHNDIEQAIKEFLAGKGLTMEGKDVSVAFQTTRKGGQKVSAVVSFTDKVHAIPGYIAPDLTVVGGTAAQGEIECKELQPQAELTNSAIADAEAMEQENQNAAAQQAEDDSVNDARVNTPNSLFGN